MLRVAWSGLVPDYLSLWKLKLPNISDVYPLAKGDESMTPEVWAPEAPLGTPATSQVPTPLTMVRPKVTKLGIDGEQA